MKPIIVIPPDVMAEADIKMLRDNDLCVVVAKDPARVRFLDPIPATLQRTEMEHAAILLSRRLLNGAFNGTTVYTRDFSKLYVELLIKETPLDPAGTKEEQMKHVFDYEKEQETRRLAREEAKAERAAAKKAALTNESRKVLKP